MEYDKIIDEQNGIKKKSKLKKLNISKINFDRSPSKMKKTYFQKFILDKYNFY